jgi:hypothetical protein
MPKPDYVTLVNLVLHGTSTEKELALTELEEPRHRRSLKRAPAAHPELLDSVEQLYASPTPRVRALAMALSDSKELAARAIRDDDARIRDRATDVLVKARDLNLFTDERASVRLRILRQFRAFWDGEEEAVFPKIVALLDDPDATVAGQAAIIVASRQPTEPRLASVLVRYLPATNDLLALAEALGQTIAHQPEAVAAMDALCALLRDRHLRTESTLPDGAPWNPRLYPCLVFSAWGASRNLDVARTLLALLDDEDPWVANSAVSALTTAPPELGPEAHARLSVARSSTLRARLLIVLGHIGESSHLDAIRALLASDDLSPWGSEQCFDGPSPEESFDGETALVTRRSEGSAAETPARWVGGLLAIRALRARKSELLSELRKIAEECEDPVVVSSAADSAEAIDEEMHQKRAQVRPSGPD